MRLDFFGMTDEECALAMNAALAAPCRFAWAAVSRSRRAALLVLVSLMALACIAPLCALAAESGIPPDVQALFVEAEGEFPVRTLHGMPLPLMTGTYWVDNHRLIYTVRKFNGWEARKDERSKIIIYDVDSGKAEETPYRGDLTCFGTDGQILVQDYAFPIVHYLQPGDTEDDQRYYLSGRLGETLTRFKRAKEQQGVLDYFSCRFYSSLTHDFGKDHLLTPLRPGDGSLDEAPETDIRLVSPEGKTQWAIKTNRFCNLFSRPVYLPWMDRYYTGTSWSAYTAGCVDLNKNSWLFSSNSIDVHPLPQLIQELRKPDRWLGGTGATYWAKPGMFVHIQSSSLLNGLYWDDKRSGKLKRVLKNPWGLKLLSPDGCRDLVHMTPPVLIELCKGKLQ